MAENPEQAAKIMRGAGEKVKAEAESVATSFERFKAALKEEVGQTGGGAGAASGSGAASKARPKSGPASSAPGGINSDIAARVQRRRR